MSVKVFDFLPAALNASNDVYASGFGSLRTGQELVAGGTLLGDAINLLEKEANQLSNTTIGLLHEGQYRRIYVDANATAANIAVGTAAFILPGYSVSSIGVLTAGAGQTPGTYQVGATSANGAGSGAVASITVNANGTVTYPPILLFGGSGYTAPPVFTLNAGGTAATFQAYMTVSTYNVTTADKATIPFGRGVFLNAITPGNFGWIQESGIATVRQTGTVTSASLGAIVTPVGGGNGTFQATTNANAPSSLSFGLSLDIPVANGLYRAMLTLPGYQG